MELSNGISCDGFCSDLWLTVSATTPHPSIMNALPKKTFRTAGMSFYL